MFYVYKKKMSEENQLTVFIGQTVYLVSSNYSNNNSWWKFISRQDYKMKNDSHFADLSILHWEENWKLRKKRVVKM